MKPKVQVGVGKDLFDKFIGGQLKVQNIRTKKMYQGELEVLSFNSLTKTLTVRFAWTVEGDILSSQKVCATASVIGDRQGASKEARYDMSGALAVIYESGEALIDLVSFEVLSFFPRDHCSCISNPANLDNRSRKNCPGLQFCTS